MKFFKAHWFAILFDILITLLMLSANTFDLFTVFATALSLLLIVGIQVSWHKIVKFFKNLLGHDDTTELSKEMEDHYASQGLSEDETVFFRKTMAQAKEQILTLEENLDKSPQLKLIGQQTKVMIAAKGIFKELVKEPQKLHMMGPFLYTHLPNIVELVSKYNEVREHAIRSQKASETLEQSLEAIQNLCYVIVQDYEDITSDDIQALNDGIDLARRNLNQQIQQQKEKVH